MPLKLCGLIEMVWGAETSHLKEKKTLFLSLLGHHLRALICFFPPFTRVGEGAFGLLSVHAGSSSSRPRLAQR